ncbi:potassium channel family protein [Bacillus sp. V59.32b]|uniref:potassium channel family protein n=1 Tax=Bacillus sp. V59.32b TaxID=1758642 RepID=UPI00265D566A|nr:potassium channel family protein [Bacillus sp. V59.32b]
MNRVSKVNHTFIFISTILVIAVSTIVMRKMEPDTFPSLFDSLWWVMTTMTTVGYGDFYPTSTGGRIFAMALYIIGIGILGVVIGKIVDSFGTFKRLRGREIEI